MKSVSEKREIIKEDEDTGFTMKGNITFS